jgi:hypothetical protein
LFLVKETNIFLVAAQVKDKDLLILPEVYLLILPVGTIVSSYRVNIMYSLFLILQYTTCYTTSAPYTNTQKIT